MITVDTDVRQRLLRYAARFTTSAADPVAVAVNAGPLLAWLEDAPRPADAEARLDAMQQQSNSYCRLSPSELADLGLADDPAEFVRRAGVLYAFATAGEAS